MFFTFAFIKEREIQRLHISIESLEKEKKSLILDWAACKGIYCDATRAYYDSLKMPKHKKISKKICD